MTNQPVFEILRAEVATTQDKYTRAKENFWKVSGDPPDGGQRLELAARAHTIAMIAYTNALHRFNEFLLNGKVPDELLPKSGGVRQTIRFSQERRLVHRCVFCGGETRMFENGHPTCTGCATFLEAGEQSPRKEPASETDSIENKVKSAGS